MVSGFNELQWYHMVGVVAGIVVCVCAVFAIATFLNNMTPILLYVVCCQGREALYWGHFFSRCMRG